MLQLNDKEIFDLCQVEGTGKEIEDADKGRRDFS